MEEMVCPSAITCKVIMCGGFGLESKYCTLPPITPIVGERIYPCVNCGKMRSKEEGGTVFTVCEECWNKAYKRNPPANIQTYSLNCEKCGKVFESKLVFPESQLCQSCSPPAKEVDWGKLENEIINEFDYLACWDCPDLSDCHSACGKIKTISSRILAKVRQALEGRNNTETTQEQLKKFWKEKII